MEDKNSKDNMIKTEIANIYTEKIIEVANGRNTPKAIHQEEKGNRSMFEPGAEERANEISGGVRLRQDEEKARGRGETQIIEDEEDLEFDR